MKPRFADVLDVVCEERQEPGRLPVWGLNTSKKGSLLPDRAGPLGERGLQRKEILEFDFGDTK